MHSNEQVLAGEEGSFLSNAGGEDELVHIFNSETVRRYAFFYFSLAYGVYIDALVNIAGTDGIEHTYEMKHGKNK